MTSNRYLFCFRLANCLCAGLLIFLLSGCRSRTENKHHTVKRTIVYAIDRSEQRPQVPRDTSYLEHVFSMYDLVNIKSLDSSIVTDLQYAGTSNFIGMNLYDGLANAYFTCDMAIRICNAQYYLKQIDSTLSIVILDAARPQHIQQLMWDSLKMHPDKKFNYLSPPDETSLHNYGCAADVTITDLRSGTFLDMGTPFDHFDKLSQPAYENEFLKTGELSDTVVKNRKLLRGVMELAGLRSIKSEWWHFSLCTRPQAIARYELIR